MEKYRLCVYALTEPGDEWDVRYIGLTMNPESRRQAHGHPLSKTTPKDAWVRHLQDAGMSFGFRVLAEVIGDYREGLASEKEIIRQWMKLTPGRVLNIGHRDLKALGEAKLLARDEFDRLARNAIRRCIMLGIMDEPEDKYGWWQFMEA